MVTARAGAGAGARAQQGHEGQAAKKTGNGRARRYYPLAPAARAGGHTDYIGYSGYGGGLNPNNEESSPGPYSTSNKR